MKQTRRSGGLLFWALAALLLVAAVGRFAAGMSQLDDMRYAGDWNMSAGAIAAEAIDTPDWGEVFYDYYQVRFELTNHSQRPVDLDEYTFEAVPQKGAGAEISLILLEELGRAVPRRMSKQTLLEELV